MNSTLGGQVTFFFLTGEAAFFTLTADAADFRISLAGICSTAAGSSMVVSAGCIVGVATCSDARLTGDFLP